MGLQRDSTRADSCCWCWMTRSTAADRPAAAQGAGCLVLVTSRRRLTVLEGARTISLDTLTHEEAATPAVLNARTNPGPRK